MRCNTCFLSYSSGPFVINTLSQAKTIKEDEYEPVTKIWISIWTVMCDILHALCKLIDRIGRINSQRIGK